MLFMSSLNHVTSKMLKPVNKLLNWGFGFNLGLLSKTLYQDLGMSCYKTVALVGLKSNIYLCMFTYYFTCFSSAVDQGEPARPSVVCW